MASFLEFLGVTIFAGLYLFLPVYAANMAPVPASKIAGRWNRPLWEARLGKNKTLVGTSAGLLAGLLVVFVESELDKRFSILAGLRPEGVRIVSWPLLGLLLGVGALVVGDMGKSLIKRKLGIKPGAPWKPWDDLDFGIGAGIILLVLAWEWQAVPMILAGVTVGFFANPLVNKLSHRAGIKAVPH